MGEIQNLSKQINFNSLTYFFQSNSDPKEIIGFKGPLGFYKSIKDSYTTHEKKKKIKKT